MLRVATVAAVMVVACLPSQSVLGFSVPAMLTRGHRSSLGCSYSSVNLATRSHRAPALRMVASNEDIQVGVSDDVQNVGRGTLLAKDDAVKEVTGKVQGLYDAYPYPPEKVFDGPTVGYNHRWSWTHAYSSIFGVAPQTNAIEILDAGCGTGVTAQYLSHLNPKATHFNALDLSREALNVAEERAQRADLVGKPNNAVFHHMSLYDVADLDRKYDFINCVGVLHHLPDPGGLMHIFVYSALGRREIMLMQEALALLQEGKTDFKQGVAMGREVFKVLPDSSRIKSREKERWEMENERDSTFADMYLHPQEVDYTVPSLLAWVDGVKDLGIEFAGFSNPKMWDLKRLIGDSPLLMEQAMKLPLRQQYRLAELLDPDTFTHYEFFLTKGPVEKRDWQAASDAELFEAFAIRQAGLQPWPAQRTFDQDYNLIQLSDAEYEFLEKCAQDPTAELMEWGDDEEPRKISEITAEMEHKLKREEILRLVDLEFLFLRP